MRFYNKKDEIFKYLKDSLHGADSIVIVNNWDKLLSGNFNKASDSTPNCFDIKCNGRDCSKCYYDFCKKFGIEIKK